MSQVTTSSTSNVIDSYNLVHVSAQVVFGSASSQIGTVKLQASNDFDVSGNLSDFAPSNWSDIPSTTSSVFASARTYLVPKFDVSYNYMRVVYTQSSGSGSLKVNVKANGW
jgi:hypothetical protein